MEIIYTLALPTHIAAGFTALVSGLMAIIYPKGSKNHVRTGNLFAWSMLVVCLSAVLIALIRFNPFLLHIGIFSFYMAYKGKRTAQNRNGLPSALDWLLLCIGILNALLMLWRLNLVLMVFGAIGLLLAIGDWKWHRDQLQRKTQKPNAWLIRHISLMGGAYIATCTAFLVVNVQTFEPAWLPWLLPTMIGSPLIAGASRKFTLKGSIKQGKALLVFVLASGAISAQAQPYVAGGKTRHRFAQFNPGMDYRMFSGAGTKTMLLNTEDEKSVQGAADLHSSRLLIGGTHFWGHTDFLIAIPVWNTGGSGFGTGVETAFRYFPWRIEHQKLRPFGGISWLPVRYQSGAGPVQWKSDVPLTAGMVYAHKNHLFEIGTGFRLRNVAPYPLSKEIYESATLHKFWISMGYRYMLESTLGAEKDWISGRTQRITDTAAARKKLNGFTLGLGPSSAFFIRKSSHTEHIAPYAGQHKSSLVFPEFNIGYYLHQPDLQFNVVYRQNQSKLSAFDFSQSLERRALSAEGFSFLGDYHGFAPFAGLALSLEDLRIQQTQHQNEEQKQETLVRPGVVAGWDIRPNRIQTWYLRTSLRYFPLLNVEMNKGEHISFDQLEVNFIQLVVFPGRM